MGTFIFTADLEINWEPRSDEEDDLADLLLPDQSKVQSEPLSVVLSPRCIQGSTG